MFNPVKMIDAGQVTRWHCVPQLNRRLQTNADHQWGVVAVMLSIVPDMVSRNLLLHGLYHDVAERTVGDLPSHFKFENGDVANRHKEIEAKALVDFIPEGLPALSPIEHDILRFADLAEALITILLYTPHPEKIEGVPLNIENTMKIQLRLDDQLKPDRRFWPWLRDNINPMLAGHPGLPMFTPF